MINVDESAAHKSFSPIKSCTPGITLWHGPDFFTSPSPGLGAHDPQPGKLSQSDPGLQDVFTTLLSAPNKRNDSLTLPFSYS